jgi:hypothetical protein
LLKTRNKSLEKTIKGTSIMRLRCSFHAQSA